MRPDRHATEAELVLRYYGEAGDEGLARHLRTCARCRRSFDDLRRTLDAAMELPVPQRPADYGRQVWHVVQGRIARSPRNNLDWQAWFRLPRIAWAGAAAAALLLAFGLGLFTGRSAARPIPQAVRERILLVAVGDHLERSQRMLIELVHAQGNGAVDISSQRRVAESLAQTNRLYRLSAERTGDRNVSRLLDELERLLVEIANAPNTVEHSELARLRARIERQGILFKIRVIGNDTRQREAASASARSET